MSTNSAPQQQTCSSALSRLTGFCRCREIGIRWWQCPPVVFLIMGAVIIVSIIATHIVASRFNAPENAIYVSVGLVSFLFIVAHVVVTAFEQLAQAKEAEQQRTKELVTLKDQFVFVAAHELRAPATGIKWALEVLEHDQKELIARDPDSFEVLRGNATRLLNLVRDLLETSRIENNALRLNIRPTSLRAAIEDAVAKNSELSRKHGVVVSLDLEPFPHVLADPVRLTEIIENLVSNAIRFSHADSGVTVHARRVVKDNVIKVDIIDRGIGITDKDRHHIFKKFWRGDEASPIESTGLGLFIVRELVRALGGEISFDSVPGKGSTFSFTVPVATTQKKVG